MYKVLITGASGFIGKALCSKLKKENITHYAVSSKVGDIADEIIWDTFPSAEIVVHLAGKTFVPYSWKKANDFYKTNILGTQNAINYCNKNNSKLIFISAYVYGIPKTLPIQENSPINPSNPYALSKYLAEQLCSFSANNRIISSAVTLRLFNVYGPGQNNNFLIPSILNNVFNKEIIQLLNPKPKRDFIYIDDVIDAIIRSFSINDNYQTLNIGSGISYSVEEIANIIQDLAKTNMPVKYLNIERENEINDVIANIENAAKYIGWKPQTNIKKGIKLTLNSMKNKSNG